MASSDQKLRPAWSDIEASSIVCRGPPSKGILPRCSRASSGAETKQLSRMTASIRGSLAAADEGHGAHRRAQAVDMARLIGTVLFEPIDSRLNIGVFVEAEGGGVALACTVAAEVEDETVVALVAKTAA